jgi:NTE family protein
VTTRALVLGGGGPVGVGWETGLAAGLEEEGVCLADADLIVGTSAGSIVGAQLALGRSPQEMLATQRKLSDGDRPQLKALRGRIDVASLVAIFTKLRLEDRPSRELRAEVGAYALQANTVGEDQWLATFGSLEDLPADGWPGRRFVCTAVDAGDGEFVAWYADAGVPLGRAIAASCSVPGIWPPVTINGRRYIDGGVRSTTNADLARGYDSVVVVSVTAGVPTPGFGDRLEAARRRLDREADELRSSGSRIEVVLPDEGSREAFGQSLLDVTRRGAAADAGYRQGGAVAGRLRELWG